MKKYAIFSTIVILLLSANVYSKPFNTDKEKLQTAVKKAINIAYPSTVSIRGAGEFSGVVVSAEGHVLTAAHAARPNQKYEVIFPDGKAYDAIGLGRINSIDAAMIKITEKGKWPYAKMGSSKLLKINEPCLSISHPNEYNEDRGPVIRFGRIVDPKPNLEIQGMIQSSCLMEPGDSGGALFDIEGQVIGIHSQIDFDLDKNYEVPIDSFKNYWEELNKPVSHKIKVSKVNALNKKTPAKGVPNLPVKALENIIDHFSDIESRLDDNVVTVTSRLSGKSTKTFATLLAKNKLTPKNSSLLVAKSSLIGSLPSVSLPNLKPTLASIVARDKSNDLVLLKIKSVSGGVKLDNQNQTINSNHLGNFLISPSPVDEGEFSISGSLVFKPNRLFSVGYLGVIPRDGDNHVILESVPRGGPASQFNLKAEDIILSINDAKVSSAQELIEELQKYLPGDKVTVAGTRNKEKFSINVTLGTRDDDGDGGHIADSLLHGKSKVREGFDKVFVHAANLKPTECGGPLFDTDGNFMGINIARYSRTNSFTIPAAEINNFIEQALTK